ncbi:hypothetical protein MMC28_008394 [Mycoblastus sanguinarius]|nr:hypothetical protein [Mycoblastus sanguinarius]
MSSEDTSSAYFPPGWSRARLVNAASDEITALPDDEKDRMYDSLRATLDPDGFKLLLGEMSRNYQARLAEEGASQATGHVGTEEDLRPDLRGPFLATLDKLYNASVPGQWGFVVYRLVYGDEMQWAEFRRRWDDMVAHRLDAYTAVAAVESARQRLRFQWVEDPAMDAMGVTDVAPRYRALLAGGEVAAGLAHSICLAVTPESMRSVLDSVVGSPTERENREKIAFAVAVDRNAGGEPERGEEVEWAGSFKVAVESLVDELFVVVGGDIMAPRELGGGLSERQVWCSSAGRQGVFTQRV